MKRILTVTLLSLVSLAASAAWTGVSENSVGDTYYIDLDNLKKEGLKRIFWQWTDYKEPVLEYYSSRQKKVLDCGQETQVIVSRDVFTQRGLKGNSRNFQPSGAVEHIAPDTVAATIMYIVCSR